MEENKEQFQKLMEKSIDNYLTEMKKGEVKGGIPEMEAISCIFGFEFNLNFQLKNQKKKKTKKLFSSFFFFFFSIFLG